MKYYVTFIVPHELNRDHESIPLLFYSHVDDDMEFVRTIGIYPDGHTGLTRTEDMLEVGGLGLPEGKAEGGFKGRGNVQITAEQFERFWRAALERVEHETGQRVKP